MTSTYKPTGTLDKGERTGTASPPNSGISYTAGSGLASPTLGNGLVHTLSYNNRNQPAAIGLGTSLTTETTKYNCLKLEYFYGELSTADRYSAPTAAQQQKNNGNVAKLRIANPGVQPIVQNFPYDAANRLTMAKELPASPGLPSALVTRCWRGSRPRWTARPHSRRRARHFLRLSRRARAGGLPER